MWLLKLFPVEYNIIKADIKVLYPEYKVIPNAGRPVMQIAVTEMPVVRFNK